MSSNHEELICVQGYKKSKAYIAAQGEYLHYAVLLYFLVIA